MTVLGTLYMLVPAVVAIILIKGVEHRSLGEYEFNWKLAAWYAALVLLFPITAILTIIFRRRLRDWGLHLRRNLFWLFAWVLPVVTAVLTVLVGSLLGFGDIDLSLAGYYQILKETLPPEAYRQSIEQIERMERQMGGMWPLVALLQTTLAGLTINTLFAFGEEMGWRGFLYKELRPLGFVRSALLIGVIWGVWHAPLILMGHNFPDYPVWGVLMMTLACTVFSVLIQYVRERTGDVLAAAVRIVSCRHHY